MFNNKLKIAILSLFATVLICLSGSIPMISADNEGANILGIKSAGIYKTEGVGNYKIDLVFDKPIAVTESDAAVKWGGSVYINGSSISDISKNYLSVSLRYIYNESFKAYILEASITAESNIIKGDATDTVLLKQGFKGESDYVTTVDLYYNLGTFNKMNAYRIYRLNADCYDEIKLLNISTPSKVKGVKQNMIFRLYFDKAVSSRKLVNMQFWYENMYTGLALPEYPYTETEVKTFFNFGISGVDNTESMIYKIQIGAEKFNGLTSYGSDFKLQYKDVVKNLELYDVKTLMYSTNSLGTGSMPLSVQIHMNGNSIELGLKGDNEDARYNLSPDTADETNMVIRLKAGFLFPTGVMLKNDVTFYWDCSLGKWLNITGGDVETPDYIDDTLNNQGGYTDAELKAMRG